MKKQVCAALVCCVLLAAAFPSPARIRAQAEAQADGVRVVLCNTGAEAGRAAVCIRLENGRQLKAAAKLPAHTSRELFIPADTQGGRCRILSLEIE